MCNLRRPTASVGLTRTEGHGDTDANEVGDKLSKLSQTTLASKQRSVADHLCCGHTCWDVAAALKTERIAF